MKNAVRILVAPWYLLGWLSHVYLALAMPEMYRGFGNTALIPGFRELWRTVVMPEIVFFALAQSLPAGGMEVAWQLSSLSSEFSSSGRGRR